MQKLVRHGSALLLLLFVVCGLAQAQEASLEHSQALLKQFTEKRESVGLGVGIVALRADLDSRAKPGKTVEAVLSKDLTFSDGTNLPAGTVLQGAVTSSFNHTKAAPESFIVVDWTAAHLPKKALMPLAAIVRSAQGSEPVHGADHTFGQNQLGATSNSGHAGDNNTTKNNSVLMNKQAGMPQIAPGVDLTPSGTHSMRVSRKGEDIQLVEGTSMVVVLFKDLRVAGAVQ